MVIDAAAFPADEALQHYPFQRGADVVPVELARTLARTVVELKELLAEARNKTALRDCGCSKCCSLCDRIDTLLARLDGSKP